MLYLQLDRQLQFSLAPFSLCAAYITTFVNDIELPPMKAKWGGLPRTEAPAIHNCHATSVACSLSIPTPCPRGGTSIDFFCARSASAR